jgi:hypothetical protein
MIYNGSPGSGHMLRIAKEKGIPIHVSFKAKATPILPDFSIDLL